MSIWKVLLIWLAAHTGTGYFGFLMAAAYAALREGDEQLARMRPPKPLQSTPWWRWPVILLGSIGTSCAQYLPLRVVVIFAIPVGLFGAVVIGRSVVIGWRTQQDAHFCAWAAAACASIAAISGLALSRFN